MPMILDERRTRILQLAEQKGFVSLQQLVDDIGVSESTIRRDLEFLDTENQVRRTRGGAAYVGESVTDFDLRRVQASIEKQRVAQVAAGMIQPGDSVLLDGGTTTLEVAKYLVGKPVQVVTNSLPIASLLVNRSEVELIFVGGYLFPKTGVALGPHAVATLKNINVRRLIMSTGGITEDGLFNSNTLLVETERQMMESAEHVTVVADHGKIGHRALARLCSLSEVDQLVVDAGITESWRQVLRDAGIDLTIVNSESGSRTGA